MSGGNDEPHAVAQRYAARAALAGRATTGARRRGEARCRSASEFCARCCCVMAEHVTELLVAGDFELADRIYARDCTFLVELKGLRGRERSAPFKVTAKRRAAEDAKRREAETYICTLSVDLIVQGQTAEAESLYRQSCSACCRTEQSYASSKQSKNCIREFIDRYRNGTLETLDEFSLHVVISTLALMTMSG